jgi:predicted component of type VI protein secretion system
MDLRAMESAVTESVWLRLVRGASREPVRMLPADLADGAISVGTADSCDWQIDAEDVPALAFYLKTIAGSLFVRAAGPAELRVDGHGVGSIWAPVERGARLTIGAAHIEVGLAGRSRRAQHALLERAFDGPSELGGEIVPAGAVPALALPVPNALLEVPTAPFYAREPTHAQQPAALYDALMAEAALREQEPGAPVYEQQSLSYQESRHEQAGVQLRSGIGVSEQLWSATIFGSEELRTAGACVVDGEADPATYMRGWSSTGLLIAGSLVACAYGCWILLLDHF